MGHNHHSVGQSFLLSQPFTTRRLSTGVVITSRRHHAVTQKGTRRRAGFYVSWAIFRCLPSGRISRRADGHRGPAKPGETFLTPRRTNRLAFTGLLLWVPQSPRAVRRHVGQADCSNALVPPPPHHHVGHVKGDCDGLLAPSQTSPRPPPRTACSRAAEYRDASGTWNGGRGGTTLCPAS